jgi:anti-anti-sigma factor
MIVDRLKSAGARQGALLVVVSPVDSGDAVVVVAGDLDLAVVDVLRDVLDCQLAAGCRDVLIDLAGLSFCSCAGLAMLVEVHRRFEAVGGTVTLTGLEGCVGRLLRLIDLDHVFGSPEVVGGEGVV